MSELQLLGFDGGPPRVEVPAAQHAPPVEGAVVRVGFGHLVGFYRLRDITLDEARGVWSARLEPKVDAVC